MLPPCSLIDAYLTFKYAALTISCDKRGSLIHFESPPLDLRRLSYLILHLRKWPSQPSAGSKEPSNA
jgi:hypothetical protein